ncbi:hypothetical protein SO802_006705 [Lithocarpus litseifolius]|uniref:Uncharacterized protein n=1 Tax=Lithocarpus litseifolius TaxID=425828 RepID=A0AAW2DP89_9ROSI
MRPPPSPHSNFFSSLKRVEKRLKLEDTSKPPTLSVSSQSQNSINLATESLSSPLYLHLDQSHSLSEPQQQQQPFLSSTSSQFPQTQKSNDLLLLHDQPKTVFHTQQQEAIDDIQRLIQLLGLSDCYCNGDNKEEEEEEGKRERPKIVGNSCDFDEGENGFYAKIVGVKGPKCGKEVERLEGWIQYFMNGEMERREPLRLAYLLLGKAAIENKDDADCGYGGLDFPTSVQQFLLNDPPTD